jgi:hypothetical protein
MSSRKAASLADAFSRKVARLNSTRERVETCYLGKGLRLGDVEAMYAGLFLQAVVAYESTIESFILGLMVKPGGVKSSNPKVRSRVKVRSYSHALEVAAGPGRKFPQWIGRKDLEDASTLLLHEGSPFSRSSLIAIDWTYVDKCRYIRNAIAHPSEHAIAQFQKHVLQSTPLPWRERTVPGFLRGSASAGQTRWEMYVAGLKLFIATVVV